MQNDDFEARLKSLLPVVGRVDAVAAAYAAGQRSSRWMVNRWRGVAALFAVIAAVPWFVPRSDSQLAVRAQIAVLDSVPSDNHQPVPIESVWNLRQAVLDRGLDGLPQTVIAPAEPIRAFGS